MLQSWCSLIRRDLADENNVLKMSWLEISQAEYEPQGDGKKSFAKVFLHQRIMNRDQEWIFILMTSWGRDLN